MGFKSIYSNKGTGTAPVPKINGIDSELYTVDKANETSAGLVDQYTSKDNSILRREAQKGRDMAGARGLTNSSIASGNAIGKVLDKSTEWAVNDSQLNANRKTENLRSATSRYGTDVSAAASRYGSDQQLLGTRYTADKGFEGTKYSSDSTSASNKYTADSNAASNKYTADTQSGDTRYTTDAKSASDKYNTDSQSGDNRYTADAQSDSNKYTADTQSASNKYNADTQSEDNKYNTDTQSGDNKYNTDAKSDSDKYDTDAQSADNKYSSDNTLTGTLVQGAVDLKVAGINAKSQQDATKLSVQGQLDATSLANDSDERIATQSSDDKQNALDADKVLTTLGHENNIEIEEIRASGDLRQTKQNAHSANHSQYTAGIANIDLNASPASQEEQLARLTTSFNSTKRAINSWT